MIEYVINMTRKTRLIILLVCVVCFFVIAPILVAYSMGYRFDFEKMKITATGGIYVRTFPSADKITIDSKISQKPGFLAQVQGQGSIFVQSLLPDENHTVLVQKNNYYDYYKTIPVRESEVTKLENIILFKKDIEFSDLYNKIDYFSIAKNNQNLITATINQNNITFSYYSLNAKTAIQTFSINQTGKISEIKWSDDSSKTLIKINNGSYYLFDVLQKKISIPKISYLDINSQQISFDPQDSKKIFFVKNKTLYSAVNNKTSIIIKNLVAYKISGNTITWLSTDGFLYNSDISGKQISQLIDKKITIRIEQNYQIFNFSGKTFLQESDSLFLLNQDKKTLEDMKVPETNYKILDSLDENKNLNLIYWNNSEIYLYSFSKLRYQKLFSGSAINYCQWLNNNYIIFTEKDKTIISEIDYRGNINTITLPQTASKIDFNQQNGKIYLLTNNALLSSDKITP